MNRTPRKKRFLKKLDGIKQILPSLETSGSPGGNRKPVVIVERKQCKTVGAWTVGHQHALNGYKCT